MQNKLRTPSSDYSSSTLGSDSGSSSSESESCEGPAVVDLTVERLESVSEYAWGEQPTASTEYAKHGMSRSRIRDAIRAPICSCKCKISAKLLLRLCVLFWLLPKQKQDAVLWGIQHESGRQKKKTWHLAGPCVECLWFAFLFPFPLGCKVCKDAWAHLLGVGKHRLMRCKNTFRGKDMRSITCKGGALLQKLDPPSVSHSSGSSAPAAIKSASVTGFLLHLYWTAAEPMATAPLE